MTDEEMARKAAALNYEIIVVHGVEGGVGFVWRETFIHNPFVDPQYGAFDVDPVEQYGAAYLESVFSTDPATALETARRQLRDKAGKDLARYRMDRRLSIPDIVATIEAVCGVRVPESDDLLATLTDEQVALVWSQVDGMPGRASGRLRPS